MKYFSTSFFLLSAVLMADTPIPGFSELQSLTESIWEPLTFRGIRQYSHYRLVRGNGINVVRAETDGGASGLIARKRVDPNVFQNIEWRWKVSNIYHKGDAGKKSGDDYPARIYIAFAHEPERTGFLEKAGRAAAGILYDGELPGSAINYIWANKLEPGRIIPNVYSKDARMIAVNSGSKKTGRWVAHKRNIIEDYRRAFGREPPAIIGIAIMSDSDNTGESATAWYGDISLSRTGLH